MPRKPPVSAQRLTLLLLFRFVVLALAGCGGNGY
jgi:hypothetical protein